MEDAARMTREPLRALGCLWSAQLSMMTWIDFLAGTLASIALRKRMNSGWRWRFMHWPMNLPLR